jgi:hypothetical protein
VGKLLQSTMSNDDYYEEQVWPLTSHTNCYTDYTRDGRWATQRHVCWHDVTKKDATATTEDDSRATTTTVRWRELPPGQLCVGYASVSSCAAPCGWEAYGLLPDQHWQQQQQSEEPQPTTLPVPVVSTAASAATAVDGTTTTFSNDNNIITAAAGGHSRSPSLVGLPMNLPSASELVDSLYNSSVPELSSSLDNNDYPMTEPLPETSTLRGRAEHNNNNNVAELIVRNYVSSTTGTDGAVTTSNGENRVQHYNLWLSYRPTAIHITMALLLKNDQATKTTTATTTPLVWMGSADHAQLHSYEIAAINNNEPDDDDSGDDDDDDDENDIDPVLQLRHNHEFPASVLAIASNSDGRKLVVASQDGSIVILQLLCNGDGVDGGGGEGTSCRLVTEATVIIDGPILALSYQQDGTITIGSLCGYVARMKDDGTKLEMIVEGLTGHNSQEDAVLAVAATSSSDNNGDGHRIWVGTRSGRCLLYRLCHSDDPSSSRPVAPSSSSSSCWKLEWQVRLPYAVNGICLRDNDVVVDDARQKRVIVTTARGIHIFRTVHSAVQQARSRLNDLLLK